MRRLLKLLAITALILTVSVPLGYADSGNLYTFFSETLEGGDGTMDIKHRTLVDSPVDSANHGKVVKLPYSASSNNYCEPRRQSMRDSFDHGELKKATVSFDILFEDYAPVTIMLYTNKTLDENDTSSDYMTLMQFGKDGKCSTGKYSSYYDSSTYWKTLTGGYQLNKWYNIKAEFDLEDENNQKFSFWIDGNLIAQNVTPVTTSGGGMLDFLTARIYISKNGTAGAEDGYVYADNFKYEIPYSQLYSETGIYTYVEDGTLRVDAVAIDESEAVLLAARYADGVLADAQTVEAELLDDMLFAQYTCDIHPGSEYKFFLFDNTTDMTPLAPYAEYRSYTDAEYQQVMDSWRTFLVGDETDRTNSNISSRIADINSKAYSRQNSMNKSANRTSLWGAAYNKSEDLGTEYGKIYDMALAYGTQGCTLYGDQDLRDDIKDALDWMYDNRYGQDEIYGTGWRSVDSYNWWDWFVGAPTKLVDILMIMQGEEGFTQPEIDKYFELYDYLSTYMRTDLADFSQLNSRVYARLGADILTKNDMGIKNLINAYPVLFRFANSGGAGMNEDYSYLAHNNHPYTGAYGTEALLGRIVKVMAITDGTAMELDDSYIDTYTGWIFNAFEPLMVNGGVMSMVRGRGVDGGGERVQGIYVMQSVLNMIDAIEDKSPEAALKLKQLIKRHGGEDMYDSYYALTLRQIAKYDEILADTSLPDLEPYENTRVYYNMDRVVHQKENWSAGLAISSERTSNYESINGQNENGWYNSDGMLYLYTDGTQYDTNYFKYADPYKRPGTTVDSQERQLLNISNGQEYFSSKDFVGGAVLNDAYSVATMDLESFHNDIAPTDTDYSGSGGDQPLHDCDLTAAKSWFMFDDEIVCLGADIDASAHEVYTTVENRRVTNNALSVNGTAVEHGTASVPTEGSTDTPLYAHIEGTGGYYFPAGGLLSYRQVTNGGYKFFEMWLEHGEAPQGATDEADVTYAYTVLPGMTAQQTAAYAASPKTEILSNTADIQAVRHNELGITGYVFRKAGELGKIAVSAPLTVVKKENASSIELAFSDPTFKLDEAIITLDGEYELASCDSQLTVEIVNGKTVITADLSDVDGETLSIKFNKPPVIKQRIFSMNTTVPSQINLSAMVTTIQAGE